MALEVEEIDITPHKVAGQVSLSFTPTNTSEVAVDPIGGPAQVINVDFIVSGNQLIWKNAAIPDSDIEGVLEAGHSVTLRVIYER